MDIGPTMSADNRQPPEKGVTDGSTETGQSTAVFLENSTVKLEAGPAGVVARIERGGEREYAGPIDEQTVSALLAVGEMDASAGWEQEYRHQAVDPRGGHR